MFYKTYKEVLKKIFFYIKTKVNLSEKYKKK